MRRGTGDDARRDRATRTVLVAVAVALLALLTVAVAGGGEAELGEPRVGSPLAAPAQRLGDLAELGEEEPAAEQPVEEDPGRTPWALIVIGVAATALAAALLRTLRPGSDPDVREDPAWAPDLPDLEDTGEEALSAMRRAARHHSERLGDASPREARDEVVAAWLALEAAAARGGTSRHAAQTPTEFTVALLTQQHADEAASAELLHLYQRARFGSSPLPDDAAARAGAALAVVADSLGTARP